MLIILNVRSTSIYLAKVKKKIKKNYSAKHDFD